MAAQQFGKAGQAASARPLYLRIDQALRDEIAAGVHPVGALLPAEFELCARFDVSRYTVREALRRLSESGLVERRQGAGTVVLALRPRHVFVQSARSMEELVQYAVDTVFEIGSARIAPLDGAGAALSGGKAGETWLRIEGTRRNSLGHALSSVTVFVAERFAAVADDLPTLQGAIFARIESRWRVPITDIIQEISAGTLPPAVARPLGVKRGGIGMRFRRRYLDQERRIMLTSVNWHPAERFIHETHLRRTAD
jgi:GntR family transcriptional regulator